MEATMQEVPPGAQPRGVFIPYDRHKQVASREYERDGRRDGRDDRNWHIAETRMCLEEIKRIAGEAAVSLEDGPQWDCDLPLRVQGPEGGMFESEVTRIICDSQGQPVGFVQKPREGPFYVKLEPPWDAIADAINADVRDKKPLIGPDRKLYIIRGTSEAELKAVTHAIRILSERKLSVVRKVPMGRTE